jgi:PQQ-dependent dehydrogenase (s-GDH family)
MLVSAFRKEAKMTQPVRRWLATFLCVLAAGCTPVIAPATQPAPTEEFDLSVLTTGLEQPWEISYGPDDQLWLTERVGKRVIRVDPADGSIQVAIALDEVYQRTIHDGLLGLALHPELFQGEGNDYVYVAFTYDADDGSAVEVRAKIRRYTYDDARETLADPVDLITNLPASTDHNSGRLLFGPDDTLYYTVGDQGNNQFRNACRPIQAQELPTAAEVAAEDWSRYVGKVLRLNPDGSIPADNPTLDGVQSHVFAYGFRNVQGLALSPEGQLYAAEHGPKTDDEINLIEPGGNYGWPHVAGQQDDQAYVYGNWSAASNCAVLEFSDYEIPPSVPQAEESDWSNPDFVKPLYTFGTVEDDYNFQIPECDPNFYICWPTVAPSGLELYTAYTDGLPGWSSSLLVTALKTGTVYRLPFRQGGESLAGEAIPYFRTVNRYRDVAIGPDGRTFFVITDSGGNTQDAEGLPTDELEHPGAILKFSSQN